MNAIVYIDLKPDYAKLYNLPIKLPVLVGDFKSLDLKKPLPLDVIVRGLKFEYEHTKNDYYKSYLIYFLYEQFKHHLNSGEIDKAEELLNYTDKLNDDYRSNFFRGLLFVARGDLKKAEVEFRRSLSKDENFIYARFELAKVLYKNEEIEDTIEELKKIILIDKSFSLAYNLLADIYIYQRNYDEALKTIIQGLGIDDGFQPFYEKLTAIYNDAGYFENTIKFYESAKSKINSHKAVYNVAFAYMNIGNLKSAINLLNSVRNENADYIYELLARCYRMDGNYEEAINVLSRGYDITLSPIVGISYANTLRSVLRLSNAKKIYEDISKENLESLFFAYYMYENYFNREAAQNVLVEISERLNKLPKENNEEYFNEFEYIIDKPFITLNEYTKRLGRFLDYYFSCVDQNEFDLVYTEDIAYNLWMALFFKDDLLFERMVFENEKDFQKKIVLLLGGYIIKYIIREGEADDYMLSYLDMKLSSYHVKINEVLYKIQKNLLQNKYEFVESKKLEDVISNIMYSFLFSDTPFELRGERVLSGYELFVKTLVFFKTKENPSTNAEGVKKMFIKRFVEMVNSVNF